MSFDPPEIKVQIGKVTSVINAEEGTYIVELLPQPIYKTVFPNEQSFAE